MGAGKWWMRSPRDEVMGCRSRGGTLLLARLVVRVAIGGLWLGEDAESWVVPRIRIGGGGSKEAHDVSLHASLIASLAPVSYTHLRAHETPEHLVCRLLLEKKKKGWK
eukprot:TRINITY_DN5409_c0_g1_i1.p1 TRINITY_DN5409_c0_g1~~TRINITY_DN5409_c0_g1_i1.p1  ORF type:complete len:108 (-),score=13.69 TRINITY_DN5409_c0_g1_i1:115-438(-)